MSDKPMTVLICGTRGLDYAIDERVIQNRIAALPPNSTVLSTMLAGSEAIAVLAARKRGFNIASYLAGAPVFDPAYSRVTVDLVLAFYDGLPSSNTLLVVNAAKAAGVPVEHLPCRRSGGEPDAPPAADETDAGATRPLSTQVLADRIRLLCGGEFLRYQMPEAARAAAEVAHDLRDGRPLDAAMRRRVRKVLGALNLSREEGARAERAAIFCDLRESAWVMDRERSDASATGPDWCHRRRPPQQWHTFLSGWVEGLLRRELEDRRARGLPPLVKLGHAREMRATEDEKLRLRRTYPAEW